MKALLLLTLAVAGLSLTPVAEARDSGCRTSRSSAPVALCTRELCRQTQCRWTTDRCGRRIRYEVVVVTFATDYSDGARRTFTRTYRM